MNKPHAAVEAGCSIAALQNDPALRLPDPLENRILLCHALGLSRVALITQDGRLLGAEEARRVAALFERRRNGEPIAYIVGHREFYGLPFQVDAGVLIPRPETELLVDLALERIPGLSCKAAKHRVLDLGTGSGAIAITLAHNRPAAQVTALDNSPAALDTARRNAENLLAEQTIRFLHSDWYAALAGLPPETTRFDLIVANPPYIAAGDAHLSQGDLRFEPQDALTDHFDGLSAYSRIIGAAGQYLAPGGWLLLEHGHDQAAQVRAMLDERGFTGVQSWRDLSGIERVSGGWALMAKPDAA